MSDTTPPPATEPTAEDLNSPAPTEGWLDMGSQLHRREHYIRDDRALCGATRPTELLDDRRRERLSDLPPMNACGTCLVRWSTTFA